MTQLANRMTRAGVLTVIATVPPNQMPIFCCNFVKDDTLLPAVFECLHDIAEQSVSTVGFELMPEPKVQ